MSPLSFTSCPCPLSELFVFAPSTLYLSVCCVQSVELTENAVEFLKRVFTSFDVDGVSAACGAHTWMNHPWKYYGSTHLICCTLYLSNHSVQISRNMSLFCPPLSCLMTLQIIRCVAYSMYATLLLNLICFKVEYISVSVFCQSRMVHCELKNWMSYSQQPPQGEVL